MRVFISTMNSSSRFLNSIPSFFVSYAGSAPLIDIDISSISTPFKNNLFSLDCNPDASMFL